MQFGYASLFVVSYPLIPLLAFVSNMVEIKVDGLKLLRVMQRAVPVNAEVLIHGHTLACIHSETHTYLCI